jgi:hypothetical protein
LLRERDDRLAPAARDAQTGGDQVHVPEHRPNGERD